MPHERDIVRDANHYRLAQAVAMTRYQHEGVEPTLNRQGHVVPTEDDYLAVEHSLRFRPVANRYPLRVIEAYGGDMAAAARDTDEQVAQRVEQWERAQGLEPRDWQAIGESEHGEH